jgi:hypothetical protein
MVYDVSNFVNSGTISATASMGDVSNAGVVIMEVIGAGFSDIDNFENSGTISATAIMGNVSGAEAGIGGVVGVYFGNGVEGFRNTSTDTIKASVTIGDATNNALVYVDNVHGVVFADDSTAHNSGTISASVTTGSALDDSEITISDVAAIVASGDTNLTNTGTIRTQITAGENVEIEEIAGIRAEESNLALTNSGNIYLSVNAPQGTSAQGAGLWLEETTATITNSGRIYLENNLPGADLRTLRAASGSDITFEDQFSIVFGMPGITERPILLEDSSLNLNAATLVADAGRDLKFCTPYPVIEAVGTSSVDGEFGGLARGFSNPDITVDWVDPTELGENAAVRFGFDPQGNVAAVSVNAAAFWLSDITNKISSLLHNPGGLYTPHYTSLKQDGHGMYVLPYYTHLDDAGLGADMDAYGVLLGYRHVFVDGWSGSIFAGVSRNEIDYTKQYSDNKEDQDTFTFGAQLMYDQPGWFVEMLVHYNHIRHDYSGRTGANFELSESDKYSSNALVSQLSSGLKYDLTEKVKLSPYAGLRWIYWDSPSHTTDAWGAWEKRYGSFDAHWFKAFAGLDLNARVYEQEDALLSLHGGVRVEQPLNRDKIKISQSLGCNTVTKKEDSLNTSFLANVGAMYEKNNFTAGVDLTGDFNSDYNAISSFLRFGYRF